MADDKVKYILRAPGGAEREVSLLPSEAEGVRQRASSKGGELLEMGTSKLGGSKPVDLTGEGQPWLKDPVREHPTAPSSALGVSADDPGAPFLAPLLGGISGATAGLGTTAGLLGLEAASEPGVPRAFGPDIRSAVMKERTALEEAERIEGESPALSTMGEMATLPFGLFGALLKKGGKEVLEVTGKEAAKGITEKLGGRIAAAKAGGKATAAEMGIREAGDIAAEAIGESTGGEPETAGEIAMRAPERGINAAMRMLFSEGVGAGLGGVPGLVAPSTVAPGLQYRGPKTLDRPPMAQALAKGQGKPSVTRGYVEGPQARTDIMEGARTGEHPADVASLRFQEKFVPAVRGKQIQAREAIGDVERGFQESAAGQTQVPQGELADTAWDIVKKLGYSEGAEAGEGLPGGTAVRDRFRRHLDEIVDYEVNVHPEAFGEGAAGEAATQIQPPGRTVPTREAVEVLGSDKVDKLFAEMGELVPEEAIDFTSIRVVPRAMNAEQLEASRLLFDQAAGIARTTSGKVDPRYERLTAAVRSGREKFPSHPEFAPETERAVIRPQERGEREVGGYAAKMHNIGEDIASREQGMGEAALPPEIGARGLGAGEGQAFRNAIRGGASGENIPQARARRQLAEEVGLGKELDEVEGVMADLYLTNRLKEGGGARMIVGGAMPHPIGTFALRPTEKGALRMRAIENAILERPRLHQFLKTVRAVPASGVQVAGEQTQDAITPEDVQNLERMVDFQAKHRLPDENDEQVRSGS